MLLLSRWVAFGNNFLFIFILMLSTQTTDIIVQAQALRGNGLLEKQLMCALDRAPCDALGGQVKAALPEIIGNNCRSCDQRQFNNAKRIARVVQTKYPEVWNALVRKYSQSN